MLPVFNGPTHAYLGASPACWRLYGRVSTLSWGRPDDLPLDRLVVDAYGAQHPGQRQVRALQSVAVHLMGLCTVLERGVQPRIMPTRDRKRVRRTLDLHWLEPPSPIGTLTVRGAYAGRRRPVRTEEDGHGRRRCSLHSRPGGVAGFSGRGPGAPGRN